MEIIAKISKNDYLTGIRVFEKEDALSSEEIVEAVDKAAEAAENDGFRGTYVDLPEKYLEMYGVSAFDYPIVDFEDYTIGETEAEKKGFHEACCGDCDAYESGTCCKWGGTCNPNDVEIDCVHGSEIYTIIVDRDTDEEERLMYCIPESMSNAEVAKELNIAEGRLYIEGLSGNEHYTIGETEAEKKGFHEACCGDCDAYESGTCYKYGGTFIPNDVKLDCVHGSEIYTIIVDLDTDEEERLMYCIPDSMSNAEVAEELEIAEDRLYIEGPSGKRD